MRLSDLDAVLRKTYTGSLQQQWEASAWMASVPRMHGPREPEPELVLDNGQVRVERRCNGRPLVSFRDSEYDWVSLDGDEVAELVEALSEFDRAWPAS